MYKKTSYNIDSEKIIDDFSTEKLYLLSTMENTSDLGGFLKSQFSEEIVSSFADFLSGVSVGIYQKKFHSSLSVLEKNGFLSKLKTTEYEKKINTIDIGVKIGVSALYTSVRFLNDKVLETKNQNNIKDFFLNWICYINCGHASSVASNNARKILEMININVDKEEIHSKLSNKIDNSLNIPHLNSKNMQMLSSQEKEVLKPLAKMVISTADLDDKKTKDKAIEFLNECFTFGYNESEKYIEDIMGSQIYFSNLVSFSSVSFITHFTDFVSSVDDTVKFAKYDINNDIYAKSRLEKKILIEKAGTELIKNGFEAVITKNPLALLKTLNVVPRKDFINLNTQLMQNTLNSEGNGTKAMDIMNKSFEFAKKIGVTTK